MFNNLKEFINSLIDNEGVIHSDNYGRAWVYKNHAFSYRDIGGGWLSGLLCCHLYGTEINLQVKDIKGDI